MTGVASLAKVAGVAVKAEVRAGLCACKSVAAALDCDGVPISEIWRSVHALVKLPQRRSRDQIT